MPKTKKYVVDKLREFGYYLEEICESGIVAIIEGSKPAVIKFIVLFHG